VHGAAFASTHAASHAPAIRSFRNHRRGGAIFWPGVDAFDYGTPSGEPLVDPTQPASGDVHYTYTQEVPWDWAHRYPPSVAPSDRPYVSSCPEETKTFPGSDGKDRTVSVMRCY
jgi:hypothetical protein